MGGSSAHSTHTEYERVRELTDVWRARETTQKICHLLLYSINDRLMSSRTCFRVAGTNAPPSLATSEY